MGNHCGNNEADRVVGDYWERRFMVIAAKGYGVAVSPHQIGRDKSAVFINHVNGSWNSWTLPDVVLWTAGTSHHEIKHKNPTPDGCFGLEEYRFDALVRFQKETQHDVMYTIHNHDMNPEGRNGKTNRIDHWMTAPITALINTATKQRMGPTYYGGGRAIKNILYWDIALWEPLSAWMDRKYIKPGPILHEPWDQSQSSQIHMIDIDY